MTRFVLAALALTSTLMAAPPVEHQTVEVNGVRLHYAKSGTGQLMLVNRYIREFLGQK